MPNQMNPVPLDVGQLLRLPRAELNALFARSDAGPVPDGEYRGTLILSLTLRVLRGAAAMAGSLVWRGKVFDAGAGRVTNRVLPLGLSYAGGPKPQCRAAIAKHEFIMVYRYAIALEFRRNSAKSVKRPDRSFFHAGAVVAGSRCRSGESRAGESAERHAVKRAISTTVRERCS
jgi:hypothetical protein